MITTKSLPVGGVIKADDVRALATLVEKAMSSATDAPADPAYRFVLVGADGTRWSCDSDDVLGPAGPLTTDRIRALRLDACIKKEGEAAEYSISIHISHGRRHYADGQNVVISGSSQDWVRSTYQAFEDHLARLEPQSPWGSKRRRLAVFLFWLGLMGTVLTAAFAVVQLLPLLLPSGPRETVQTDPLVLVGAVGLLAAIPSMLVVERFSRMLRSTFPDVELRTGPTHGQTTLQKRKMLTFLMTTIILPFFVSILASVALAVFT